MTSEYDDILHMKRPVSRKHPPMSLRDRAAQFAPFAALTGYDASIRETARRTDRKIELSETELEELNLVFSALNDRMETRPALRVTCFFPDERKEGGTYREITGNARSVDRFRRLLYLTDETVLNLDDILRLELL